MVLLHFRTDNSNNEIMAKFDSLYQGAYIQYSNIGGNIYLGGLSNNQLKFFNFNNQDDRGLRYNDNIISVDNINCLNLKNNDFRLCVELPYRVKSFGYFYDTYPSYEYARKYGVKNLKEFKDGFLILLEIIKCFIKTRSR
jgi:hypothetical protein